MFARLGRAVVERLMGVLCEVIHSYTAIIEASTQQVGVVLMDVETHHPTLRHEQVLGVRGVLEGIQQDHSIALLHEVICRN